MPTAFRTRVFVALAALTTLAVAGLSTAASSRGMLDQMAAESARIEQDVVEKEARYRFNQSVLDDVMAGRRTLRAAAALSWATNGDDPGYALTLESFYPELGTDERAAINLIHRAAIQLAEDPARCRAVVKRLRAEYRAAFGHEPMGPTSGPDLVTDPAAGHL